MELNELRIGNWIIDEIGRNVKVESISEWGINLVPGFGWDISWKPVQLTEEWLIKLGLSNKIDEEIEDMELLIFFDDEAKFSVEIIPDKLGIKNTFIVTLYNEVIDEDGNLASQGQYEIEYDSLSVHQLQNLHFALKNEELTVKL